MRILRLCPSMFTHNMLSPLSVLMQVLGMFTEQASTLQDRAKGCAEFSMIPLQVLKSSVVSLLLFPQRPEGDCVNVCER